MSANTILTSVVTGGSNSHATVAEEANTYATDFVSAGVVGTFGLNSGSGGTGSFAVNADASPDMGVTVKAGQAYIVATPSGQNSQTLRARAAADYTAYTINANASGSTKYDWIYLSVSATNANTPSASADNVTSIVTSRSSSNSTDNGTPPTYGLLLAVVTVANGASSITNSNISDRRVQASVSTAGTSNTTGWVTGLTVPTTVTANGNRSYSLVFNGTDITGTVSAGMRLRTTRLVPAPTQCTSLNGTTQYYSKSSPANMAQTDKITEYAWIKPDTYKTAGIISRNNGTTDGWKFYLNSSGQIVLAGARAGDDLVTSYQSVPLNKWTHVSASIDTTTTTGVITIDGVSVPVSYTNNANTGFAAPTTAYLIGATNSASPTDFFSGKIAQAASFNAVVSAATILTYISQGLSGSETSEISAYSFNNSINDLNANANNLTANGSAVATNSDSPFTQQAGGTPNGSNDYAIIQSSSFSTNTTLVVQVPEGNTIPTSGGVSAISYATVKTPYGMPVQRGKWEVVAIWKTQTATAINNTTANVTGLQFILPIGAHDLKIQGWVQTTSAGTTNMVAVFGLSSSSGSFSSDLQSAIGATASVSASVTEVDGYINASQPYEVAAQTTIFGVATTTGNQTVYYGTAARGVMTVQAVCANL